MGTLAEHKKKAEHNLAFLRTISDEYPDWLATAAFYVAVQLVEAMLANRGVHSDNHGDRNNSVRSDFPSIRQAYKALYNASLIARYDPPDVALPAAQVRGILIEKHLAAVQAFAASRT